MYKTKLKKYNNQINATRLITVFSSKRLLYKNFQMLSNKLSSNLLTRLLFTARNIAKLF